MARDTHRIMPHENGWQVDRDGGKRPSRHGYQDRGGKLGREISRNQQTELIFVRKDGSIERSDSHGNDPRGGG